MKCHRRKKEKEKKFSRFHKTKASISTPDQRAIEAEADPHKQPIKRQLKAPFPSLSQQLANGPLLPEFNPYHIDPNGPSHYSNFVSYVPTPKPEWKRYKQYTKTDLMDAIEAVRSGMTALQVRGRKDRKGGRMG